MTVIFYSIYKLLNKLPFIYALILSSYLIIFIRLIVREGFYYSFFTMIFVITVYSITFIMINFIAKKNNPKKALYVSNK